jgi:hypothetical protein
MTMTKKHDDLAAWAESDAPQVRPGAVVRRGQAARDAAAAILGAAAEDAADVAVIERARGGRPSLAADAPKGTSPLWQVRAPEGLDAALRAQAEAEGRSFSEVLRDAAREYLAHRAAS